MNNYYNKFYDKEGKRLAKGDIVYNAKGDIVGAKGDIVGAKGDIVGAKGDIVGAKGDIVGAKGDIVGATGDILSACGAGDEWDWETGEFCESYTNPESVTETEKDGTKLFNVFDHIFDYAHQTAEIVGEFKDGKKIEGGAVDYTAKPPSAPKEDMKMWYVAGGVIVVLIVGVVLIKKSK